LICIWQEWKPLPHIREFALCSLSIPPKTVAFAWPGGNGPKLDQVLGGDEHFVASRKQGREGLRGNGVKGRSTIGKPQEQIGVGKETRRQS
jgi:hypothetical protein